MTNDRGSSRPARTPGGAAGSRPRPGASRQFGATRFQFGLDESSAGRGYGRWIALAVMALLVLVFVAPTFRAWMEQRQEIHDLQSQVDQQRQEVEDLRAQRDAWNDPAYIERQARDRLKYIRPGEQGYTVIDDTGRSWEVPTTDAAVPTDTVKAPWYETIGEGFVALSEPNE